MNAEFCLWEVINQCLPVVLKIAIQFMLMRRVWWAFWVLSFCIITKNVGFSGTQKSPYFCWVTDFCSNSPARSHGAVLESKRGRRVSAKRNQRTSQIQAQRSFLRCVCVKFIMVLFFINYQPPSFHDFDSWKQKCGLMMLLLPSTSRRKWTSTVWPVTESSPPGTSCLSTWSPPATPPLCPALLTPPPRAKKTRRTGSTRITCADQSKSWTAHRHATLEHRQEVNTEEEALHTWC